MMPTTDDRDVGARIGDYVIERELAARPGLVAWVGKHALLPRRARISTVELANAGAPAFAAQLTREACILEVLRHAGVPRVFECGQLPDGRPWVARELIEDPSLTLLLEEEGSFGAPRVLALLAGIGEILHHAHARGLVHRNLRPDAIASRPEGPCVVDWSDARTRESEAPPLAPPDQRAYQPPEVLRGAPADSRADVFALGVIAYEALTGARPPAAIARRPSSAPPRLLALLERMVARDPVVRPTSAEVRVEALSIAAQLAAPARPPTDDYGAEVQIVDVELGGELLADTELDAGSQLDVTVTEVDDRKRTQTLPPALQVELTRTKTDRLPPDQLLSRTQTEQMPTDPEPQVPRTATRISRPALPEPSRTKTP